MAPNKTLREPTVPARASTSQAAPPQIRRNDKAIRTWFRGDRVFNQNGAWYISTREGINIGPYATHSQAQRDIPPLIEHLCEPSTGLAVQDDALTIRQFIARPRGRSIR